MVQDVYAVGVAVEHRVEFWKEKLKFVRILDVRVRACVAVMWKGSAEIQLRRMWRSQGYIGGHVNKFLSSFVVILKSVDYGSICININL